MPYLIVFLTTALTALVGPWVDAPLTLSTLSGLLALATAALAVRNGKIEIEVSEGPHPAATVEGSSGGTTSEANPNQSVDQHEEPQHTAARELHIKSLEDELSTLRAQNDELARERVELLRKAAKNDAQGATIKNKKGAESANANELRQLIRQRDALIQAQQISMGELRKSIDGLRSLIGQLQTQSHPERLALDASRSRAVAATTKTDAIATTLTEISAKMSRTLQRTKTVSEKLPAELAPERPVSLLHLTESLSTLYRRLDDSADKMRIAAMNARLLHERPTDGESLDAFAEELSAIAAHTEETSRASSTFLPAVEKVRVDLQRNEDQRATERREVTEMLSGLQSELNETSDFIQQMRDEISTALLGVQGTLKEIEKSFAQENQDHFETHEVTEKIKSLSDSIDLTLDRMIEMSKITTTRIEIETNKSL